MLAVAPPPVADADDAEPELASIKAFRVPGDAAVMLSRGTWHAGPLFADAEAAFFNLELSDTNIADHWNCDLVKRYSWRFGWSSGSRRMSRAAPDCRAPLHCARMAGCDQSPALRSAAPAR